MRGAAVVAVLIAALAVSACARLTQQPQYVMVDPQTGQPIQVVQQAPAPSQVLQARGPQVYAAAPQASTQPAPVYAPPSTPARRDGRGLFSSSGAPAAAPVMQAQAYYPPQVIQVPARSNRTQTYTAARQAYAAAPTSFNEPYTLDAGDRLRIVVFGQDGISNSYMVDAGGNVTLPLVGAVTARGHTTMGLGDLIAGKLRQGFVRDPKVSVEVESYRPFFILGEVTTPGQYPYSPNMTVETAVAIAGGFAPRASKSKVKLTRNAPGQQFSGEVPLNFPIRPGDTVQVQERWF